MRITGNRTYAIQWKTEEKRGFFYIEQIQSKKQNFKLNCAASIIRKIALKNYKDEKDKEIYNSLLIFC